MDNLGQIIMESEYINTADLMGIELDNAGELLGRIQRMPQNVQNRVMKKLVQKQPPVSLTPTSRMELEQKFTQLPKEIRDGLLKKRLQLVDTRFYVVKEVTGKNGIDVFQGTDQKSVGLGNVANQKLEKDNWFILSAIRMQYAEAATKEAAAFGIIIPVIRNGEMELEAGNKKIIGLTDNEIFDNSNRTDAPLSVYKLESTKIIEPQVEIKMPVKFTAVPAAPAAVGDKQWLKVTFIGTSVIPY